MEKTTLACDDQPDGLAAGAGTRGTVLAAVLSDDLPMVLRMFLATRVAFTLIGLVAVSMLQHGIDVAWWDATHHDSLNVWWRWDGFWYFSIMRDGYSFAPGLHSNTAFFPLYPMVVRALAWPFGRHDMVFAIVGLVVSNVSLLVALVYLMALTGARYGRAAARRAAVYTLLVPTTLFFSAGYSESLFLALTVATFYYAEQGRWWRAALLSFLACLCRQMGVVAVVALLWEYFRQKGFDLRRVRADIVSLAAIPAGVGAYMLYLYLRFGDPLLFVHAETQWDRHVGGPWGVIAHYTSGPLMMHGPNRSVLDLVFTFVGFLVILAGWRRLPTTYNLYLLTSLLVPISTGRLQSIMRFELVWFPLFIVLALLGRNRRFDRAFIAVSAALAGMFMALFAAGYWVA